MSDNPQTADVAVDYSPFLLRGLIAFQLVWIAIVGAMARGYLPEAFSVLALPLPVMLLGAPALAMYLAADVSRPKLAVVAVIQAALFGLQLLALLPAVQ